MGRDRVLIKLALTLLPLTLATANVLNFYQAVSLTEQVAYLPLRHAHNILEL